MPSVTYTIYKRPRDFPDNYVVRKFAGEQPTDEGFVCLDLDEARLVVACLLPAAVCFHRSPGDDPVIVETWL